MLENIYYFVDKRGHNPLKNNAVLIHAIKKKTNKIPVSDMNLCLKRKAQVNQIERTKSRGDLYEQG